MTRRQLLVAALVFGSFAAFASYRAPIPGVNEPQYLGKAKHFWDREWCGRDLLMSSADAHFVFYATIGGLTRVFTLEQTAWIGRLLVWAALAIAWTRLASQLLSGPFAALWSAWIFLGIQASGSLSGEWLIGGVEAKGFAYASLLVAIEAAASGALRRAAVAAGIAVAFHPIVGLWGTLALAFAWFVRPGRETREAARWKSHLSAMLLWLLCALPGLVPALPLVFDRPSIDVSEAADRIQVFVRLKHHLDPKEFPRSAYVLYGGLLAAWIAGRRLLPQKKGGPAPREAPEFSVGIDDREVPVPLFSSRQDDFERFFARFVLASLAIAGAGLAIAFWPRWPGLMKYYPFRLFDLFLPIAAATTLVGLCKRIAALLPDGRFARITRGRLAPALGCVALVWSVAAPGRIANPPHWKPGNWHAFVDACLWVDQNTPRDALFLTPRQNVGFKWYAQRAELVTWKDCPQDAPGIVEWKSRLDFVERWRKKHFRRGFSNSAVANLESHTHIDYVLDWNVHPWRLEPAYRNEKFSVYAVPKQEH